MKKNKKYKKYNYSNIYEEDKINERKRFYEHYYGQDIVKLLKDLRPLKPLQEIDINSKKDISAAKNIAYHNLHILSEAIDAIPKGERIKNAKLNNLRKKIFKAEATVRKYIKTIMSYY